ncbi:hypothetical protein AYO21_08410 [Fonsecaea monophora]|uniref:Major facilitator superfamily (MFS) profile domain-containing protein n=1 Tax=Fonsecaea monophora TaxID=254056 RepID=A0A177EZ45_9EURO|nr:hypothetical protein AYO21_08410 [Fonsecaea monophora]OAG37333.1 hypothetical protein AYO21_08410 [Fonsecaea monophora]
MGDDLIIQTDHVELSAGEAAFRKRLNRKIDLRVIPFLIVLLMFCLIDRTNIGTAKVAGMGEDLNLDGNKYSVALLVFFLLYTILEIPSISIIRLVGVRNLLAGMVLGWGVVSMCHAFVNTYAQLVVVRLLLGMFEAGFQPACIYLISSWYTRYETQHRLAVWFTSGNILAAFSGIISYGLSLQHGVGGLEGWRWIFLVPGLITVVLTLPIWFWASEFPEKAKWLAPEELTFLRRQLQDDRAETLDEKLTSAKVLNSVQDWRVWVLSSLLFFVTASVYTLTFFTPTILNSIGFSVEMSQILVTPPYIFGSLVSIATGILADKLHMRSPFIIAHLVLQMLGFVLIGWGPNIGSRMTGIFFSVAGSLSAIPTVYAFLANNVVGASKRQISVPLQTTFGGIGGIAGSLYFRQQDFPNYRPGLYATFTSLGLCLIITSSMGLYFWSQNRKADRKGKILEGLEGFRYTI